MYYVLYAGPRHSAVSLASGNPATSPWPEERVDGWHMTSDSSCTADLLLLCHLETFLRVSHDEFTVQFVNFQKVSSGDCV